MAEEVKKEEQKSDGRAASSTLVKVVLGLGFLCLALYLLIVRGWWGYTWTLAKEDATKVEDVLRLHHKLCLTAIAYLVEKDLQKQKITWHLS